MKLLIFVALIACALAADNVFSAKINNMQPFGTGLQFDLNMQHPPEPAAPVRQLKMQMRMLEGDIASIAKLFGECNCPVWDPLKAVTYTWTELPDNKFRLQALNTSALLQTPDHHIDEFFGFFKDNCAIGAKCPFVADVQFFHKFDAELNLIDYTLTPAGKPATMEISPVWINTHQRYCVANILKND